MLAECSNYVSAGLLVDSEHVQHAGDAGEAVRFWTSRGQQRLRRTLRDAGAAWSSDSRWWEVDATPKWLALHEAVQAALAEQRDAPPVAAAAQPEPGRRAAGCTPLPTLEPGPDMRRVYDWLEDALPAGEVEKQFSGLDASIADDGTVTFSTYDEMRVLALGRPTPGYAQLLRSAVEHVFGSSARIEFQLLSAQGAA